MILLLLLSSLLLISSSSLHARMSLTYEDGHMPSLSKSSCLSIPSSCIPTGDLPPFAQRVHQAYGQQDEDTLVRLLRDAATREARLLCLYRLYPLTQDETLLAGLPTSLSGKTTARELALLSALWGFRTASASPFKLATYGKRAEALIREARDRDGEEPLVLLIEGQALLFKPRLFGGNPEAALERFDRLRIVLDHRPEPNVPLIEAEVWRWYALHQIGHPDAEPLRQRLRRSDLPPLYRQFLAGA